MENLKTPAGPAGSITAEELEEIEVAKKKMFEENTNRLLRDWKETFFCKDSEINEIREKLDKDVLDYGQLMKALDYTNSLKSIVAHASDCMENFIGIKPRFFPLASGTQEGITLDIYEGEFIIPHSDWTPDWKKKPH